MTIRSGTSSYGTIYFSDGDDGSADEVRGFLDYNHSTNTLQLGTNGSTRIRIDSSGFVGINETSPTNLLHVDGGTDQLKLSDGSGSFEFRAGNVLMIKDNGTERLRIDSSGHVLPGANNTYDLGSTAKGWRNVYMNDLNLSNMNGDTNDVDGTQGSWTIQEGKDDLYIINRLNGKKFKIKMEEIS